MKRVLIVQARMTSTRLPGKVLMPVAGRPMLVQQLQRLKRCRFVDEMVVATTRSSTDDPVVTVANQEGVRWFRGHEYDVLERYVEAAREARADLIVRITADCPLIDPEIVDRVIQELEQHGKSCDYATNVLPRTFPRGLDTEAFFRDVLERVHRLAQSPEAREHVTTFIRWEHPELFWIHSVTDTEDNSDVSWTVDTANDLLVVRTLYETLHLDQCVRSYREVLQYMRKHPELGTNS